MLKIAAIALIVLLSGCGYSGCISQNDVFTDSVRTVVHANPPADVNGQRKLWVKADFPLDGKEVTITEINYTDLEFCHGAVVENLIIGMTNRDALPFGATTTFPISFPYDVMQGEKLIFSLNPVLNFDIDDNVCRNNTEGIFAPDYSLCESTYLNSKQSISMSRELFGSNAAAQSKLKSEFSNMWYFVDKDGKESPYIWGFPAYMLGVSTEAASGTGRQEDIKYLCYDDEDIDEEASALARNEIGKAAAKGGRALTAEDLVMQNMQLLHYKLQLSNTIAYQVRSRYKKIFDEISLNKYCGNICDFSDDSMAKRGAMLIGKPGCSLGVIPLGNTTGGGQQDPFKVSSPVIVPFVIFPAGNFFCEKFSVNLGKIQNVLSAKAQEFLLLDHAYVAKDNIPKSLLTLQVSLDGAEGLATHTGTLPVTGKSKVQRTGQATTEPKYRKMAGKYSFKVTKDCSAHIKKSLYYIMSKDYPRKKPGDPGTQVIDFLSLDQKSLGRLSGDLYYGVKDNGDGYSNNRGTFEIHLVAQKKTPAILSYLVTWTENRIRRALYGGNTNSVIAGMYRHISQNGSFIKLVNALLVLYLMISTLYFFLGFSRSSIFQLFCLFAKVIIVIYVLRPDSWQFFNDHLLNLFVNGPKFLISAMTGTMDGDKALEYEFMDLILSRFLISKTWIQILGILFSGPVGWLSICAILWGIFTLVECLFSAVIIYLIAIMTIGLLLCIAPFFIICVLFKRTKAIFDAWIKVLLQTSMQPVIVFASIALLGQALNGVLHNVLNFESCETCVLRLDLGHGIAFCLFSFLAPIGVSPIEGIEEGLRDTIQTGHSVFLGIPGSVFNILVFVSLARAAKDFVINSGEMCSIMFGAFTNLSDVGHSAVQSILSVAGLDDNTGYMLQQQKRQFKLFDRGPDGGREESFVSKMLPGKSGRSSGPEDSAVRRRGIVLPENPPPSF